MPDYGRRLDAFRARLATAGLSGAFLPESADLEYLTGVPRARNITDPASDPEVVVEGCFVGIESGPLFLFTDSEWSLPAAVAVARWESRYMSPTDNPAVWLRDAARAVAIEGTLGVGDGVPFRQLEALRVALPNSSFTSASTLVMGLRIQKDDEEIERIRRAGSLALTALEATLPRFGTRFRRSDFLSELEHELVLRGSDRVAYAPDMYAVGPTVAIGWSADVLADADAEVRAPAAMSVDFGAVVNGYRSDIGRTIYVGEPPPGQETALRVVRKAHDAAVLIARAGTAAEEVDAAARRIMDRAGLGDAFWIPSGHGIGLEIHELPRLRQGVTDPLLDRAVIAVEIAAWKDGELSAFWEDEVVVRPNGGERLTGGPDQPYVIG